MEEEELINMGFPPHLAAQALAATGGKSILKATDWLLERPSESDPACHPPKLHQQVRVDRFFHSNTSRSSPIALDRLRKGENAAVAGWQQTMSRLNASDGKKSGWEMNNHGQQGNGHDERKTSKERDSGVERSAVNGGVGAIAGNRIDKRANVEEENTWQHPSSKRQRALEQRGDHRSTPRFSCIWKNTAPLAERMRPISIDEIVGQGHLLGRGCILRSLVENDTLPSVIFWGPPGTGKTSLAKAISNSVSYRFVSLSAVTSGLKEVREVLEEAKRLRKAGQRTLFFVDEVHRFNKAQQDAFLPSIEAGHVVFIGATTENPSFEINGALLSRCRVLTLNKLQPEDVKKLLERSLYDRQRGVLAAFAENPLVKHIRVDDEALNFLASAADGDARVGLNALEVAVAAAVSREKTPPKTTKQAGADILDIVSHNDDPLEVLSPEERPGSFACGLGQNFPSKSSPSKETLYPFEDCREPSNKMDGGEEVTRHPLRVDTVGLFNTEGNAVRLELGVDCCKTAPVVKVESESSKNAGVAKSLPEDGVICVDLFEIREALQRSHLQYDKTGEEHYNIISALHKSMRGGDPDAALYWLARMLQGGEGPLYVARRLIRFASEDVGLADPQALLQAVACYQSCHFLGMPECNVHLAQCVVYLSLAPKSIAVYRAIEAAQQVVKESGQNEPVPLHLRNAPTNLMKHLGYAKGYIYPPACKEPVNQEYLPTSLRGLKFLDWP